MTGCGEAYVAFDVCKDKHAVAIAEAGRGGEVRFSAKSRARAKLSAGW